MGVSWGLPSTSASGRAASRRRTTESDLGGGAKKKVMISALPKDAVPMYAMGVDQPKYIGSENVVSTLLALPPVRRRWRSGARVLSSVVRLMTTTHTTTATQLKVVLPGVAVDVRLRISVLVP